MRLIIDISEELYKANLKGLEADEVWDLRVAIKNGTPIPDNATVEDVINIVTNKALPIAADDCGIFMSIPTTWLKRPYQKGGKE